MRGPYRPIEPLQLLNPKLDFEALAAHCQRHRYVVVNDLLAPESAQRLYDALVGDLPWEFWRRDGDGTEVIVPERWALTPVGERAGWIPAPPPSADQFHFAYERVTPVGDSSNPGVQILRAFVDTLNSEAYLGCMKFLTGTTSATKVDGAFSCYRTGHYLSPHTDANRDQVRLAAHVLAMTPSWERSWGGDLVLCTENGEVLTTVAPRFNSLVLFEVPRWHFVSAVTAPLTAARHSFFGWLVAEDLSPRSTDPTRVLR